MELMIAAGKAVPQLMVEHGLAVDRVYTGSFMTSLDMDGLLLYIMSRQSTLFCFPFSSMIWMHLSNQGP
jgi:dihydroxyacetone kinase